MDLRPEIKFSMRSTIDRSSSRGSLANLKGTQFTFTPVVPENLNRSRNGSIDLEGKEIEKLRKNLGKIIYPLKTIFKSIKSESKLSGTR